MDVCNHVWFLLFVLVLKYKCLTLLPPPQYSGCEWNSFDGPHSIVKQCFCHSGWSTDFLVCIFHWRKKASRKTDGCFLWLRRFPTQRSGPPTEYGWMNLRGRKMLSGVGEKWTSFFWNPLTVNVSNFYLIQNVTSKKGFTSKTIQNFQHYTTNSQSLLLGAKQKSLIYNFGPLTI